MNIGKTLFAQVMDYVPWKTFGRIIDRHGGDAGVRALDCADVFRVMAFSQLTWRESLRDIESCLASNQSKLFHMGLSGIPARSTLSDALNQRDWRIYHELAMRLIVRARDLYAKESTGLDIDATVYALDSTTIDLCLSLFDWAPFRSTKAAVKMHTLLDFGKLFKLHQAGAYFVTRAKRGMNARRVYSNKSDRSTGVICDQPIRLNGFYVSKEYPEHLRRIRFKDPETGKTLVFLTNNTALDALTIAALYKKRWQVELFFKWIKQHLRIKRFLGTSENAVKTQIWCAVSTYVLIAIIKKELQLNVPLYTMLQILSVSIFEKTLISCALQPDTTGTIASQPCNQMILFDF